MLSFRCALIILLSDPRLSRAVLSKLAGALARGATMRRVDSAPMTARARARIELTEEIKAAGRRQLAEVGAADLSLRAVARELGMVSSAVYRYVASRDDLLTLLLVDAYDALGQAVEDAALDRRGGFPARWVRMAGRDPELGVGQPPRVRPGLRQPRARLPGPDRHRRAGRAARRWPPWAWWPTAWPPGRSWWARPGRCPGSCTPTWPASGTRPASTCPTRCWPGPAGLDPALRRHQLRALRPPARGDHRRRAFFAHQARRTAELIATGG